MREVGPHFLSVRQFFLNLIRSAIRPKPFICLPPANSAQLPPSVPPPVWGTPTPRRPEGNEWTRTVTEGPGGVRRAGGWRAKARLPTPAAAHETTGTAFRPTPHSEAAGGCRPRAAMPRHTACPRFPDRPRRLRLAPARSGARRLPRRHHHHTRARGHPGSPRSPAPLINSTATNNQLANPHVQSLL